MSLEGSIKENINELIYEAIETTRCKKHKIQNEFPICNYLNTNTDKIQRSLLFLLPLDVALVFLDKKKWILNSIGLYSGGGLINAFSGFYSMLYKIKQ